MSWRVGGAFAAPFTAAAQQRPWFGPGRDGVLGGELGAGLDQQGWKVFFCKINRGWKVFWGAAIVCWCSEIR